MNFIATIANYILLGTVQGLCEFLPVSSSGHLVLLQRALGFSSEGGGMTLLNLLLHFGTLLPVVIVLRRDIASLLKRPFKPLLMLLAATLPAGLAGVLFAGKIDALFAGERGGLYLALCFCITAVLLLICETCVRRRKRTRPLSWGQTAAMGLAQAIAILPGISRSGATVAAGTLAGAEPKEAAHFSFLMSIPVILGGAVLGIGEAALSPQSALTGIGAAEICGILLGVAAAAVSGYFAVRIALRAMGRANYRYFSLYLILISLFTFGLSAAGIL